MRPYLVIFAGAVGAGKTTQINLVSRYLENLGYRFKKTGLKSNCLLSRIMLSFVSRSLQIHSDRNHLVRDISEQVPLLLGRVSMIWLIVDFLGVLFLSLLKVNLPLKCSYTVLCEDYLPAVAMDYLYFSKKLGFLPLSTTLKLSRILLRFIPRNSKLVILDADDCTLKSRWAIRRTRDEIKDYLAYQRMISLIKLPNVLAHIQINTSHLSIHETFTRISKFLEIEKAQN